MTESTTPQWYSLLGKTNRKRVDRSRYSKEISALRKGANSTTEHYAYPYVLPYTEGLHEQQKIALLRVCAMLAEYPAIADYQPEETEKRSKSFGRWCYQLSIQLNNGKQPQANDPQDFVGRRIAYLHTQDLEEACLSIRRLLAMAAGTAQPPQLDTYGLTRMLLHWGNGLSPESQKVRQKILRDYYSAFTPSTSTEADFDHEKE